MRDLPFPEIQSPNFDNGRAGPRLKPGLSTLCGISVKFKSGTMTRCQNSGTPNMRHKHFSRCLHCGVKYLSFHLFNCVANATIFHCCNSSEEKDVDFSLREWTSS